MIKNENVLINENSCMRDLPVSAPGKMASTGAPYDNDDDDGEIKIGEVAKKEWRNG